MNQNSKFKPQRRSIAQQVAARADGQALWRMEHTIRSKAMSLGADKETADDLVVRARSVFTIVNAVPIARNEAGETVLGANGLPLSPEDWVRGQLENR